MKFGLPDTTIENIQKVFETNAKIDEVIVFGSRAKGNYKEGSDIDLAVKGMNISFNDILKLHGQLEDLNLPYEIDLLDYETIKEKALVEHIDRIGIVFYERWKETEIGRIPSNWKISEFTEICEFITDGSHFSPKETLSGNYMASVKDMRYSKFDFTDCKKISDDDFDFLVKNNCDPQSGDILISKDGANCLDLIFVYNQPEHIVVLSSIAIARLKKHYYPNFYRYFLLSPNVQFLMRNHFVSGSAIPRVVLKDFKRVPVLEIDYDEQISIASVLSCLDSKIDLLQRQNKTLEQLAKTIFTQWFVEEADESWELKALDEIAFYLNGLALQKYPAKGNNYLNVIKIRELKQGISENTDTCSSDIPKQYVVHDGDILFSWSGSLEVVIWYDGDGALNQHLFKVTSDKYPKWFYYLATKSHLQNFRAIAETKSTTMGHIQREHLSQALISIPPDDLFKQYDQNISPLVDKIINNNFHIKQLTQLRDALLPKLMSGEVRVNT